MNQLLIPSIFLSLFGNFSLLGLNLDLFFRQTFYFLIGVLAFICIKKIGINFFYSNYNILYWFFVILLFVTFVIGLEVKGSKRWLDFYFIRFQPSEFFKVFFILFLANELSKKNFHYQEFFTFTKIFFLFIIPTFIIFKQPDFGNAISIFFIFFVMILFSNFSKKYIICLILIFFLSTPIIWSTLADYQKARIFSFLNPKVDFQGDAYNMVQSVITTGSGKFFGRGLGLGTQSRLAFLPENHTDFAYATLVEQFGFFGGFLVLFFYGVIIYLITKRAFHFNNKKNDEDGKKKFLFITGFLSYVVFHLFVNVGMNLGILPIAGVALPFISYGGSALITIIIGFALIP